MESHEQSELFALYLQAELKRTRKLCVCLYEYLQWASQLLPDDKFELFPSLIKMEPVLPKDLELQINTMKRVLEEECCLVSKVEEKK
jgi:hypothetical protein